MKQRLCLKIARSLCAFSALILSLLARNYHPSLVVRQVNGNVVTAQLQNTSLPALSERANGVNSRYLSAASTASLAAATVAAANGGQSSSSQQDSSRNQFLLHQQQVSASGNGNQQANSQQTAVGQQVQQQAPASPQPATISSGTGQVAQFNSPQGAQVALGSSTPIMSSTYTYNPLTGQFVPTDLSTGQVQSAANLQSSIAQLPNQLGQFQAQQPFFVAQQNQFASQPPRFSSYNSQPAFNNFANINGPYAPYNQQRGQQQFNRRTGYQPQATRLNPLSVQSVNHHHQQQPAVDDDMSGFFQQQQMDLGGNFVNNLDGGLTTSGVYGAFLQPSNSYLIANANNLQSSGQQQHQHQHQTYNGNNEHPLPTSQSSVIIPSAGATFGSAPAPPSDGAKSDQCVAADNRHGTCYQASECIKRGGTPMGKCGSSNAVAEFSGSSYVCCLFDVTCGQFAAERFVYFRNPNYPNTYDQSRMCRTKIGKLDKSVCQFRLDLLRFDVAKPTNGNCSNDMFVVSGQNENYIIPKICGLNDGQHYYVGVDESGVITLHMMMMGYYRRSFEILITQIPCRSDYAAPAHCLQYYMGTHGTIKSFNYDDELRLGPSSANYEHLSQAADSSLGGPTAPYGLQFGAVSNQLQQQRQHQQYLAAASNTNSRYSLYGNPPASLLNAGGLDQFGGYPNDLDYTMCIRKESGFCSITYQLSRGEQGPQPFAVGHPLFGLNSDSINGSAFAWHPVSTECRDDYLLIGGVRLCSGGGGGGGQLPADLAGSSIQFAQNGTVLNSAGIGSHQLHSQLQFLVQQLARVQQQQQLVNVSYAGGNNSNNNNSANQLGGTNLEQQQASILQQIMLIQQQLNSNTNHLNRYQQQQQQQSADNQYSDLQGAIITDTTSGPFILRFVSNTARNAKGFQIDYRQNPCK